MPNSKIIYLGSDHAGWHLKEEVKRYLDQARVPYEDLGNLKYEKTDDYPDYAWRVARKVAQTKARGILFCHNGVGVCIVANKVKGIRAVNAQSVALAREARADNNTNILCLGGEYISLVQAKKIIKAWLTTSFSQAIRHQRRVKKIQKIEKNQK